MFDPASFLTVVSFSAVYGGIEYRYINRREEQWTKEKEGFYERPLFAKYTPYHVFFLLPLFIAVSFTLSISAWAGNVFLAALVEDVAYFVWRGRGPSSGEWTTQVFGSFGVGGAAVPVWWPLDLLLVLVLYLVPVF